MEEEYLGVFQDEQLYLVDVRTSIAYACDGSGARVSVGTYLPQSARVLLHEEPSEGVDVQVSEEDEGKVQTKVQEEIEEGMGREHAWKSDPADHCETPSKAHEDLEDVLMHLATCMGKAKHELLVYDPYYCTGKAGCQLKKLGFLKAYNEPEDFYRKLEEDSLPEYDCIVTNPPYSAMPVDHVQTLMEFLLTKQGKPWFVLQPNYVYTKEYWCRYCEKLVERNKQPRPFFLTPSTPRKYVYKVPKSLRTGLKSKARSTAPFVTFWYCWLGNPLQKDFLRWWNKSMGRDAHALALSTREIALPNNFKDSSDRTRRKRKNKKRKRESDGCTQG